MGENSHRNSLNIIMSKGGIPVINTEMLNLIPNITFSTVTCF